MIVVYESQSTHVLMVILTLKSTKTNAILLSVAVRMVYGLVSQRRIASGREFQRFSAAC